MSRGDMCSARPRRYHPCGRPEAPEQQVHLKDFDHYFRDDNNGRGPLHLAIATRDSIKVEPEPVIFRKISKEAIRNGPI
jgi:hypothetical protein